MIGKAIFAKLSGAPAISAIVSTRVFPAFNTSAAFPQIVYTAEREPDPAVNATRQLKPYQVTLHMAALSYIGARALAQAVFELLANGAGIGPWGGDCYVSSCVLQDETESELGDPNFQQVTYNTVDQVYRIWAAFDS